MMLARSRDLATRGAGASEGWWALITFDGRWTCNVLHPVCGVTAGRPGLFIKAPAACRGLPAMAACLVEVVSINVRRQLGLTRQATGPTMRHQAASR